jgi:hypothetical protein
MGRPRTKDDDLPKCVYRRGKSFYLVKKNVWTKLCEDRSQVESLVNKTTSPLVNLSGSRLEAFCHKAMVRARCNARGRRKIDFNLCADDVKELIERCGGLCAITRMPFRLEVIGERNQRPFAPSIDRIDSMKGYTRDNCRLVCVAVNYAMNSWGETVIHDLFAAWKRGKK